MNRMKNAACFVVVSVLAVAQSSCKNSEDGPEVGRPVPETTSLPSVSGGDGDCVPEESPKNLCYYGLVSDAVVYGRITDLKLVDAPARYHVAGTGNGGTIQTTLVDSCPDGAIVTPAFEITLSIERVLGGSLQVGAEIGVRMNPTVIDFMDPSPVRGDGGVGLDWDFASSRSTGKPLSIGQRVGFSLGYDQEHGVWYSRSDGFPMYEYQPLSDGKMVLVFQRSVIPECDPAPQDAIGLTAEEFASAMSRLSDCSGPSAQLANERKEIMEGWERDLPGVQFAADCQDALPPPEVGFPAE